MTESHRPVVISQLAQDQLAAIPSDALYLQVKDAILRLSQFPLLGRLYDPGYDAARPPVTCRVLYAGRYGVYYTGFDAPPDVPLVVLAVEDERRDPMRRFSVLGGEGVGEAPRHATT